MVLAAVSYVTCLCHVVCGLVQHNSQQIVACLRGGCSLEVCNHLPHAPKLWQLLLTELQGGSRPAWPILAVIILCRPQHNAHWISKRSGSKGGNAVLKVRRTWVSLLRLQRFFSIEWWCPCNTVWMSPIVPRYGHSDHICAWCSHVHPSAVLPSSMSFKLGYFSTSQVELSIEQ